MMVLETDRLLLRPYTMINLDFFASLWADPEVVHYIGEGVTRSRDEAEERIRRIIEGYESGYGLPAIRHKSKKQLVGHAGLVRQVVEGKSEIELGYWLARDACGQGLATEAAVALRDHAFTDIGLHRIISLIQPGNTASIAVAQRVGMKLERAAIFKGQAVCIYSIASDPPRRGEKMDVSDIRQYQEVDIVSLYEIDHLIWSSGNSPGSGWFSVSHLVRNSSDS